MNKILGKSLCWTLSITTTCFAYVPEKIFAAFPLVKQFADFIPMLWKACPLSSNELSAMIGKTEAFVFLLSISIVSVCCLKIFRRSHTIKGKNFRIKVKYGELPEKGGRNVITFDECFTTKVGNAPGDIKPSSLCGQYLLRYPIEDMQALIEKAELRPEEETSAYRGQTRYKPGSLVPRNNDLLMAFARLNEEGLGFFASRNDYLAALEKLWEELDKHYNQHDIFIPVLGAGVTRIGDISPTMQELVDMIICSYKLSQHKIKTNLCIVSKRTAGFSLDRIGEEL